LRQQGFPVELVSELITTTETVLELRLKRNQINAAFTLDIGGQALVEFGPGGQVVSSTVPFEVEGGGKRVTLTLPFPLLDTTMISFAGGLNATIDVGDGLKASVGRYRLDVRFDPALLPAGATSLPRTVQLDAAIGEQGCDGQATLGPDDITANNNNWRLRGGDDEDN